MLPQLKSLLNLASSARARLRPPRAEWFLSSFVDDQKLSVQEITPSEFARAVEDDERRRQSTC